jgi:hypothetical protein
VFPANCVACNAPALPGICLNLPVLHLALGILQLLCDVLQDSADTCKSNSVMLR